jgi:ATP-dependent exoDNAse (exonuclease V) beta subunit
MLNNNDEIEEILNKLKYFNDDNFKFDPEPHIYTYKNDEYISCTTFLKQFTEEFDSKYWSQKKASERGIKVEEIIAEWDQTRDRACELGTTVHDWIEHFYMINKTELTADNEANSRIEKFNKIYESRLSKLTPIASEVRMFSKKWKLAGTFDQLYYYDGDIIIGDWKTNKKLTTDKDYAFNKLKYPFQSLKNNDINKYSIQISIYRLMLEEVGINVSYGFICHIPPGEKEATIYKLKDFRSILKKYLNRELITEVKETKLW